MRNAILAFIKAQDAPVQRRDIARALNIKGPGRTEMRAHLTALVADGALSMLPGNRYEVAGAMPPVAPIDIMSVDDDGDLLCMPANWRGDGPAPMIRLAASSAAKSKPTPGVGDRILARLRPAGDDGYVADIIKRIGKGAHRFLAVYRKKRQGGVAEPVERRARNNFIIERGDAGEARDGDLVWVETKNSRGYGPKKARVRSVAGHIDDRNAFSTISLANHGIPTEFAENVIAAAKKAKLPPLGERTDLRDTPLITIDPADAKDHDDAVFAEPDDSAKNPGGFRVIVAIADVSFFVPAGGPLDIEALRRGNSVYLPDRVVPMLPERLSNDLCSLREGLERPCLAVEMILNAKGVKVSHRFIRAIMRSHGNFSYDDAQTIENGKQKAASKELSEGIRNLFAAYRARWTERGKRAPLDLDLPERKVILDKNGHVKKVIKRDRFDAHRMIEEFMILANVAAAETLERARAPLIYRVHDQPDPEKLDAVRTYLDSLDYSLVKGGSVRPANFNQLLKIADSRDEKEMISEIILRSQRQAVYDTDNLGHFGLNLPRYAHFTSPIRRYADLTVHRALVAACNLGVGGQKAKEADALASIAEEISNLERRAIAAERDATDRYLSDHLASRLGSVFNARIRGVTKFGLFVALDETGADGFVPMRTLGFERFHYEEGAHALIGQTTRGEYRLGQEVEVRLAEAIPLTGGLRFEMLSDPLPGMKRKRGATTKKRLGKKAKPGKKSQKVAGSKSGKRKPPNPRKKPRRAKSNAKPRAN